MRNLILLSLYSYFLALRTPFIGLGHLLQSKWTAFNRLVTDWRQRVWHWLVLEALWYEGLYLDSLRTPVLYMCWWTSLSIFAREWDLFKCFLSRRSSTEVSLQRHLDRCSKAMQAIMSHSMPRGITSADHTNYWPASHRASVCDNLGNLTRIYNHGSLFLVD